MSVKKQLVFLESPGEGDLRDIFGSNTELSPSQFVYQSPDANELRRVQIDSRKLAVYWKPKSNPGRHQLYEHTYSWTLPTNLLEPGNTWVILTDMQMGKCILEIESSRPITYAAAFDLPRALLRLSEIDIYRHALSAGKTERAQPVLVDGHLKLELIDLQAGKMICCVFFYEGGVEFWKSKFF